MSLFDSLSLLYFVLRLKFLLKIQKKNTHLLYKLHYTVHAVHVHACYPEKVSYAIDHS